jgi:uncharacterized protein involved in outer membrane biogenesis
MKKILFGVVALLVLLVGAVLVVPGLIDWTEYKSEIASRARAMTGREVALKGDIRLALLPAPALRVTDVAVASLPGAKEPQLIRLKSLEVRVALAPLLSGRIEVESVRLVEPVVALEILGDGKRTWDFAPAAVAAAPVPPARATEPARRAAPAVRLDNFVVDNGVVVFRDAAAGIEERIEGVAARVTAASLEGPFESAGSFKARGLALSYVAGIGKFAGERAIPVNLSLYGAGAKLQSSGTISDLAQAPRYRGKIKLEGENLAAALAPFAAGLPVPLAQAFSVEGSLAASAALAELKDIDLRLGDSRGTGSVAVKLQGGLNAAAQVSINRLDLDRWLAQAPAPASGAASAPSAAEGKAKAGRSVAVAPPPAPAATPATAPTRMTIPKDMAASLILAIDAITLRGGLIGQVRLKTELADGEITLSQASAQLPGGSDIAVFGFVTAPDGQPKFDGQADVAVGDLRGLLKWLDMAPPDVPADRLRGLKFTSKIAATPTSARLSGLDLAFDGSRLTGTAQAAFARKPAVGIDLVLDRINLDSYFPPVPPAPKAAPATPVTRAPAPTPAPGAAPPTAKGMPAPSSTAAATGQVIALQGLPDFDADVKLTVKIATARGLGVRDAVVDLALKNRALEIRRLAVADLGGMALAVSGRVDGVTELPLARDVRFDLRVPDVGRAARALGIEPPDLARGLGAVTASGKINGNFLAPQVDAKIAAAGATVTFAGRALVLPAFALDGAAGLNHDDPARLAAALGLAWRPSGKVGPLGFSGQIKTGADTIDVTGLKLSAGATTLAGALKVATGGARPRVVADLTANELVIDQFLPPQKAAALPAPLPRDAYQRDAGRRDANEGGIILAQARQGPPAQPRPAPTPSTTGRGRWTTEPIDLALLKDFDADVKLKAKMLAYDRYRMEDADVAARLDAGALKTERLAGRLFGGDFQGALGLNAQSATAPRIEAAFALKDGDVASAVRAFTGEAGGAGRMALEAKLTTTGGNVAAMVESLNGSGSIALTRLDVASGARGSALAGALDLVRALGELGGALSGRAGGGQADVTGTFTLERGIARSSDLRLASGFGNGQARGSVDLARWQIDMAGEIQLAQNLLTQILDKSGRTAQPVPFSVAGALGAPTVRLDTSKLPGGLSIPGADRLLKKPGVGDVLQGIIGGQPPSQQPPSQQPQQQPQQPQQQPPQQQPIRPQDLLRGILR